MADLKRTPKPKELYEENRENFNKQVSEGFIPDFSNQNLSDLDLTGFNLKNANLKGAYLRGANLGGLDLSEAMLFGASLKQAKVSGCLFPQAISADEIRLSVDLGTRLRIR
ncbi:MAG: pentapeptide repeat-containing protein [Candidatus Adiutrix sp.]